MAAPAVVLAPAATPFAVRPPAMVAAPAIMPVPAAAPFAMRSPTVMAPPAVMPVVPINELCLACAGLGEYPGIGEGGCGSRRSGDSQREKGGTDY